MSSTATNMTYTTYATPPVRTSALKAQMKWREEKQKYSKLDRQLKQDMGTSNDMFTKDGKPRVEYFGAFTREELLKYQGDGNCLPRSIAKCLDNIGIPDITHTQLRRDVGSYMRTNRHMFAPFFESQRKLTIYIEKMERNGEYCDGTFISVISNIYNVKVNIFNQTTRSWTVVGQEGPDIFVSYENNNHYSLLTPR
jgi:hypothetical protein